MPTIFAQIRGISIALAALILCGLSLPARPAPARAGDDDAKANDEQFNFPSMSRGHPRMRELVTNAFRYVAPEQGTIDNLSGYPVEGWNQDPQRGMFLRSFTQLTAIGLWIDLLADIAAGQADNPYISRKEALDRLLFTVHSLRHDQHDPEVSANGLLGNFLGFDGQRRRGPLSRDVSKQDILVAFGEEKGSAIWQALQQRGWIVLESTGQTGVIQRGPQYGLEHFGGALAPFAEDATKNRLMKILDRRAALVAYGDNANLSAAVAQAIGALLRPPLADQPAAIQLRQELEQFLEDQRPGYQYLFDPKAGLFRFGFNASTGKFFGWEDPGGQWKVGHSDYLINEFRGPTMFVVLRYSTPTSALANLGVKIKPYRFSDGRLVYTPAPWEGSAFQGLGLSLSMGELHDPSWKSILQNFVHIELDYSARRRLPGFLSEAYSGHDMQYTGAIGIPEITVSPNPRITDAPSLYTLGIAYTVAPDGVERLLENNWAIISQLLTDHGPWEGYNISQNEAIRLQTTAHVLSLILGALNTASDNMGRYLNWKNLGEPLEALYRTGGKLDLLSEDTKAIAWTPDRSSVWLARDAAGLHLKGDNVGQAGLTFVLPGQDGASLSGGLLTIRYKTRHEIDQATIGLDRKDHTLAEAGLIPSEIFLDLRGGPSPSAAADGEQERTIEIPLPAGPALAGVREVALLCGSSQKRGPLDICLTAFRFAPLREDLPRSAKASARP